VVCPSNGIQIPQLDFFIDLFVLVQVNPISKLKLSTQPTLLHV